MPLSASAGGAHGLGDNDDEASLWEVLMVLGVVASRFFYVPGKLSITLMCYSGANFEIVLDGKQGNGVALSTKTVDIAAELIKLSRVSIAAFQEDESCPRSCGLFC
jgi:hypothetical protein